MLELRRLYPFQVRVKDFAKRRTAGEFPSHHEMLHGRNATSWATGNRKNRDFGFATQDDLESFIVTYELQEEQRLNAGLVLKRRPQ